MNELYKILKKLDPGDNILIEIQQLEKRLKVQYVGWIKEKFIITSCPLSPTIKNLFINKPYVSVIFLLEGKIYSGNTYVMHCTFKPTGLIFLAEPEKLDVVNLRKAERINCFLPAKLIDKEKKQEYEGIIVDISVGGCGFIIDDSNDQKNLKTEQEVVIEFNLPNIDKKLSTPSIIKRFFTKENKVGIGIAFKSDNVEVLDAVSSYIKEVTEILE